MKRTTLIITLLITLSLACSLSGLTGSGDDTVTQNEPPPQSENRCGDDVCDGPENAQNCPEDCTGDAGPIHPENNSEFESLVGYAHESGRDHAGIDYP